MPGAHKIGTAISGPRIADGNFMDIALLLKDYWCSEHLLAKPCCKEMHSLRLPGIILAIG